MYYGVSLPVLNCADSTFSQKTNLSMLIENTIFIISSLIITINCLVKKEVPMQ